MKFDSISSAIKEIKAGGMVVVLDNEDRENEGDLVMASDAVTPSNVNFMAKEGRGLICISVSNGDNYVSNLKDMQLEEFKESEDTSKDLVVTATSDVLIALINKEMSPIKAYMTGELKVKASLTDMLLLKKLF